MITLTEVRVRDRPASTRSRMFTSDAGEGGEPPEQVAEALGALVGGQDQGRHDEVARRIVDVVGELAQGRRQPVTLEPRREAQDLGADRPGRDAGAWR